MISKDDRNDRQLNTLTGASVQIKTLGSATDDRLTVIDFTEPANSSPPIFTRHEFIEVFVVTSGVLAFEFQHAERLFLSAGDHVTCESWRPHSFWNETADAVSVTLICSPAGLDRFFIESDELLQRSNHLTEHQLQGEMGRLRERYGLEHVGAAPIVGARN